MIMDGQNYFSNLASGDSPTAVADNASGSVIDQQGRGSIFSEGGGAEAAPMHVIVRVQQAGVSGGGGSIQAVVQDSPDNVTFTDRILGPVTAAASVVAGSDLLNVRLINPLARYVRVIYRITSAVFTAGTYISFLTQDRDVYDLSQRQATGTIAAPTGAANEAEANGVLAS